MNFYVEIFKKHNHYKTFETVTRVKIITYWSILSKISKI